MDVILQKDFEDLGKAMDVVRVKSGYARNYLFPNGIAAAATKANMAGLDDARKMNDKREEKKLKEAHVRAKEIEKIPCTIAVKVGEEDRIFGSVTNEHIADFLKKEGFEIDKRLIDLEEPIKQLGVYTVTLKLYKDVSAQLKVWVVNEESAAG
jgi:large subunit ribosomal protein L9